MDSAEENLLSLVNHAARENTIRVLGMRLLLVKLHRRWGVLGTGSSSEILRANLFSPDRPSERDLTSSRDRATSELWRSYCFLVCPGMPPSGRNFGLTQRSVRPPDKAEMSRGMQPGRKKQLQSMVLGQSELRTQRRAQTHFSLSRAQVPPRHPDTQSRLDAHISSVNPARRDTLTRTSTSTDFDSGRHPMITVR